MSTLMMEIDHDAELARLARYVGGSMSEAEVEQFKTELVADGEFFDRMAPLLAVWFPRQPLPAQQREVSMMRAEAAEIREADLRWKQARKYIAGALGSLLAVKPMLGGLTLAATAVIAALVLPNDRPSDTLTKPPTTLATKTAPPTPTQVASAPVIIRSTPTAPSVRAFVLPVDTAAERAVDAMMSTPLGVRVSGTKAEVVATGPTAGTLKPVATLAWAVSPSDTIALPKLDTRKGVRATIGAIIHGKILGKLFGKPKQPPRPEPAPPAPAPLGGTDR